MYKEGEYFSDITRHQEDTDYKVKAILRLLIPVLAQQKITINSYADVGCGSGGVVKAMKNQLNNAGYQISKIQGFDISPHVSKLQAEGIEFKMGDFSVDGEVVDLVTLTDVFEHVTAPANFIADVAKKARILAFHIPLDDCFSVNFRNLQRAKIKNPGHLIFLNTNTALNLITASGLKILDYDYSLETLGAPSNNETVLQKIAHPFKVVISKISPWLLAKIFGFSLVVIAENENYQKMNALD
jgi:SAM-dependent methyltransferase